MMNKNNKKGFTLAELLIVVAIIAVLVAVAIPTFQAQLEKSREGVDAANIRSAYAEVVAARMGAGDVEYFKAVGKPKQQTAGWVTAFDWPDNLYAANKTTKLTADTTFKPDKETDGIWVITDGEGKAYVTTDKPTAGDELVDVDSLG